MHIFCAKMSTSRHSHYTYCLQEGAIRFGLRVSAHFRLEVSRYFGIENLKKKISNIHKDFLNYTNFS